MSIHFREGDRIVDVLCQCGWGRLAIPETEVPECCPVCGHVWVHAEDDDG